MTTNDSIFGANARIIGFAWYELLEKFYSNHENEAKFQKWLKDKEKRKNEEDKFVAKTKQKKRSFSIVDLDQHSPRSTNRNSALSLVENNS